MVKEFGCVLDNLVLYVESVSIHAYELLYNKLCFEQLCGTIPNIRVSIGQGMSEYHYRMNIGKDGGAITVGFKHNSAKPIDGLYTMRIEFNPQKEEEMHKSFFKVFNRYFGAHTKKIKQMDLAFDVPVAIPQVMVYSLTGRDKSYFKNTLYFGSSGNNGRLKVYDKKAELKDKQGVIIEDDYKTRIEYTIKFDDAVTAQLLSKLDISINNEYKIVVFDDEKVKGELKACILAVQSNMVQMKEFTRTTKTKIKKALEDMEQLDLDHAYTSARADIVKIITSYFRIA